MNDQPKQRPSPSSARALFVAISLTCFSVGIGLQFGAEWGLYLAGILSLGFAIADLYSNT